MNTSQRQFSDKNSFAFSLFQYLCSLLAGFVTRSHIVMDLGWFVYCKSVKKNKERVVVMGVGWVLALTFDAESKSA